MKKILADNREQRTDKDRERLAAEEISIDVADNK